jgi:hypothetical protein
VDDPQLQQSQGEEAVEEIAEEDHDRRKADREVGSTRRPTRKSLVRHGASKTIVMKTPFKTLATVCAEEPRG